MDLSLLLLLLQASECSDFCSPPLHSHPAPTPSLLFSLFLPFVLYAGSAGVVPWEPWPSGGTAGGGVDGGGFSRAVVSGLDSPSLTASMKLLIAVIFVSHFPHPLGDH